MAWPDFYFIFVTPEAHELSESERSRFLSLVRERRWAESVKFFESLLKRHPFPPALNALAMDKALIR